MREVLLLLLLFLIGIAFGHAIWPEAPADAETYHRYHRGKVPGDGKESPLAIRQEDLHPHPRVLGSAGQPSP